MKGRIKNPWYDWFLIRLPHPFGSKAKARHVLTPVINTRAKSEGITGSELLIRILKSKEKS